jgi:hypothetical protein
MRFDDSHPPSSKCKTARYALFRLNIRYSIFDDVGQDTDSSRKHFITLVERNCWID